VHAVTRALCLTLGGEGAPGADCPGSLISGGCNALGFALCDLIPVCAPRGQAWDQTATFGFPTASASPSSTASTFSLIFLIK